MTRPACSSSGSALRVPGLSSRGLLAFATIAVAVLGGSQSASAQLQLKGFLLERYVPSNAGSDWFVLESLDFRGQVRPAVKLGMDWSQKPFVLEDAAGTNTYSVVERQLFMNLGVSLNVVDRLKLSLDMPLAVDQKGAAGQVGNVTYPGPGGAAFGDLRVGADLRLFGSYGDPFIIAVGAQLFLPTGQQEHYTSDGIVRVMPRLLMAGEASVFAYALDVAFLSRDEIDDSVFQGRGIGHELFGGVAVGVKPIPQLLVGGELVAFSRITDGDFLKKRVTPAEALFSARVTIADQVRLAVGAGPGLTPTIGSPEVRFLARLEWVPPFVPPDRDGDGILDKADACPDVRGIATGDPATNGCPPPPDRDADKVIDSQDACPDDPGVATANPATNGCPPPRDRDGDGVFDPADACPDQAGVKTDDPQTNGCPPPPDRDKDGVLDNDDVCPDQPGKKTDDPKTTGCPDSDGDGILDPVDACSLQAGPADPDPKKNGCPLARVEQGQVRILEQVKFKTGSAVILPESDPVLDAVAKILKEHPEIKSVRVEGHTDNRGGKAMNKKLSTKRAASVATWLTTKGGVDKSRVNSQGFGMERPIADNRTEEGRRDNRRVEFHIEP